MEPLFIFFLLSNQTIAVEYYLYPMAWKDRLSIKWVLRRIWLTLKWGTLGFFFLSVFSTIVFRWVPIPVTPLMLIRTVQQGMEGKDLLLYKDWVSMKNISANMQLAVICAEDQKYLDHYGFDVEAIRTALERNKKSKKIKGASTISQQTAKNIFLWPSRTWVRKGFEVYFTFLIETFWSKERILEVYLNIAEMGDGIYGVEAAGQYYYKKPASELSRAQAAMIAACLPNPRRYKVNKPSTYLKGRQAWIMRQMRYWGGDLEF